MSAPSRRVFLNIDASFLPSLRCTIVLWAGYLSSLAKVLHRVVFHMKILLEMWWYLSHTFDVQQL